MKYILLFSLLLSSIISVKAQLDEALENQLQTVLENSINSGNHGVSAYLITEDGQTWSGTAGENHENPVQVELRNRIWEPFGMSHTYFNGYDIYGEPTVGITGAVLKTVYPFSRKTAFTLANNGVYFVTIRSENQMVSKKLFSRN